MGEERTAEGVLRNLIEAFDRADLEAMAPLLATDGRFFITDAAGGVFCLSGRDAFMANISAMDVETVRPKVAITQILSIH
ncbi:MAG: hypothetical protein AAGD34_15940, partial [Pseudomonadota bacterium]